MLQADLRNDIKISKKLSYLLRHGAVYENLKIDADGYILLSELLHHLPNCSLADIQRIVDNDSKRRYTLKDNTWIKANQGHSIVHVNQLNLTPVVNPNFSIIHGTYFRNWISIKRQGLSRMNRNHIHFSKDLNFGRGLRQNAEVLIYINFSKATGAGILFFEAENGVILSAADETGFINKEYFHKVVTRKNEVLDY
uniref:2'-phosphotransferase n=1 Tax=Bracon brevicornis TaxID=1563983 RepID=A0A6V7M7R2_9HYME